METENIKNLCRTCANKEENMSLISSSLIIGNNMIVIAELLHMFNIGVSKDFPGVICPICLEKVLNAHEFKTQCERSTAMFQSIIHNKNTFSSASLDDSVCNYDDINDDSSASESNISAKPNKPKCIKVNDYNIDPVRGDGEDQIMPEDIPEILDKSCNDEIAVSDAKAEEKHKKQKRKQTASDVMFCAECNKPFRNKYILISHVKRHQNKGQFLCNVCGKGFNAQSCLSRHTRVHTGERKYECDVCHKRFPSSHNLRLHSRRHSGIKPYLCTLCGKCFSHPTGLTYHLRTHTKEKPYACDVCGRRFTIQCHRERHRKTHSGERPFPCNMCDKAFIKKFDLQRHQDVHLGNKPHVCSVCNKAFVRKMHLNYHMMVHTEERPHVCDYCGKGFIRRYYLTSHVKKHHSCDVSYREATETYSHIPS